MSYLSIGSEESGKIVSVKLGMRPNTVGPNIMPANSSAITVGSLISLRMETRKKQIQRVGVEIAEIHISASK